MKFKHTKSLIIAVCIGLIFPYSWIVYTGEAKIYDKNIESIETRTSLSKKEQEELFSRYSREMTVAERMATSVTVAKNMWQTYIITSAVITLIIFLINIVVWPSNRAKP